MFGGNGTNVSFVIRAVVVVLFCFFLSIWFSCCYSGSFYSLLVLPQGYGRSFLSLGYQVSLSREGIVGFSYWGPSFSLFFQMGEESLMPAAI